MKRMKSITLALVGLSGLACTAQAQPLLRPGPRSDLTDADTLVWRAGVQWARDDNVFKEASGSAKADNIAVTTAGVRINKPWSLQRLELDASLDDLRYQNYSALNFTALNYNGAFRWAFTPRLRGNLVGERREYIDLFSDVSNGRVNRRTEQNHGLDAEYEIGAAWRALAGVFERRVTQSLEGLEPDATVRGGEVGARYDFRSGNSLGYRLRQGQGEYSDALTAISGFTDQQHELDLQWRATGQVRVGGRLGWLQRDHDQQPVRDFSGWTGRLQAHWQLTGKTSVAGGLIRELAPYQVTDASYYEGYRLFIAPEWKPTAKTAVRLRLDHGTRNYKGSPVPTALPQREDRLSIAALALEWEPIRALRLMASVQRDERNSNRSGADYRANVYSIAAQASF
jgi:exopolysaccharide biosynthesis operon protein EpsL